MGGSCPIMRIGLWWFLMMLSLSASEDSKEYVLTLDAASNFTQFISKQNFIALQFYASWCGKCKKFAPEWEKAARILSENEPPVLLAKIDANEHHNAKIASAFDVKGYPTIHILRFGGSIVQDYKGPLEAEAIVDYLNKQSGPASAELTSSQDVAALINLKKLTIVGVFPDFLGDKFDNFTTLAERLRAHIDFFHTKSAKLLPLGDTSVSGPFIRFFKPFDELFVDFQEFDVDVLTKLVSASNTPLVTLFNSDPENFSYMLKFLNSRPNAKVMMYLNFSSYNFDAITSKFRGVAEQFKGQGLSFLIGDVVAGKIGFELYGLREEQLPLIIIETNDGQKYLKANVVPDHIPSLLKDFVDGKLQPYRKSEAIPEVNNEPVKVVVADNFDDMLSNSGKNVLLEFCVPWDYHCQKLAPILDEVAVSFQGDADVVIAKINADANDYPHETFDIKVYPTLVFKSASGKMSKCEGSPTKENIINYIRKNKDKAVEQDSLEEL